MDNLERLLNEYNIPQTLRERIREYYVVHLKAIPLIAKSDDKRRRWEIQYNNDLVKVHKNLGKPILSVNLKFSRRGPGITITSPSLLDDIHKTLERHDAFVPVVMKSAPSNSKMLLFQTSSALIRHIESEGRVFKSKEAKIVFASRLIDIVLPGHLPDSKKFLQNHLYLAKKKHTNRKANKP